MWNRSDIRKRIRAVLIAGPTASGKSSLAMAIARETGGVVINADASQVYQDLRILSARPSVAEEEAVPHRLYGFVPSTDRFSVKAWLIATEGALAEIEGEGRLPILVGGTGLYFRAILRGLADVPPIPSHVRAEAEQRFDELGPEAFQLELSNWDREAAERIPVADRTRRIRAYEVVRATGRTLTSWINDGQSPLLKEDETARLVVIPDREGLYAACDARFRAMVDHGALEEVRALLERDLDPALPVMKALGVPQLAAHLKGKISLDEAIISAQTLTRRYAKRQLTWVRGQMRSWRRVEPQQSFNWAKETTQKLLFRVDR